MVADVLMKSVKKNLRVVVSNQDLLNEAENLKTAINHRSMEQGSDAS